MPIDADKTDWQKLIPPDDATTMPEACRSPSPRDVCLFAKRLISREKVRCTFTYTSGKNYVNTRQAVVTKEGANSKNLWRESTNRIIRLALGSFWMPKACCRGILGAPATSRAAPPRNRGKSWNPHSWYDASNCVSACL